MNKFKYNILPLIHIIPMIMTESRLLLVAAGATALVTGLTVHQKFKKSKLEYCGPARRLRLLVAQEEWRRRRRFLNASSPKPPI